MVIVKIGIRIINLKKASIVFFHFFIWHDSDLLCDSFTVPDGMVQSDHLSYLTLRKINLNLWIGWWAGSGWNDSSCFPDRSETIIYWFIPLFSGLIDHWRNVQVSFLCTPIHIDWVGGLLLFNRDLMGKEDNIGQGYMWFQFYLLPIQFAKRLLNFWRINKVFSVMCSPLTQWHKLYSFKDPLYSVPQLRKLKENIQKDKICLKSIHVHKKNNNWK